MAPLRFAANLAWLFQEQPTLPQRMEAAAQAGFAAVELAFPYAYGARELRAAAERAGLEVVLLNTPPGTQTAADSGSLLGVCDLLDFALVQPAVSSSLSFPASAYSAKEKLKPFSCTLPTLCPLKTKGNPSLTTRTFSLSHRSPYPLPRNALSESHSSIFTCTYQQMLKNRCQMKDFASTVCSPPQLLPPPLPPPPPARLQRQQCTCSYMLKTTYCSFPRKRRER